MLTVKSVIEAVPDAAWAWGPGIVILVGMWLLARQFLKTYFPTFLAAQQDQVKAMQTQAEAMSSLANSVKTQSEKDGLHSERVLLYLKILNKEVQAGNEEMVKVKDEVGAMRRILNDLSVEDADER